MDFTEEQKRVIESRNKNLLVSAAAGSGKTAVLTERIIGRVMDEKDPVDIDRILTVTFTNAAASEMRERIRNRLLKVSEEHPENPRVREQLSLIHNAGIMTIDSFCVRVIRDNFDVLGIDPSFRVGDENEAALLREDACEEILEEAYEEGSPEFHALLNSCSPGKDDSDITEYIMKLSRAADSRVEPEEWLFGLIKPYEEAFNAVETGADLKKAADDSAYGRFIMDLSDNLLNGIITSYEELIALSEGAGGPYMYLDLLESERSMAEGIRKCSVFSERFDAMEGLVFDRLKNSRDESVDPAIRERVKNGRSALKESFGKLKKSLFDTSPEKGIAGMALGYPAVRELIRLTNLYRERYLEKKEGRNILDFSDVEHFALEILKGDCAGQYRDHYLEVMTDEYQDSNLLQEEILKAVSRDNDYFCVGDVKQSIYSFRLAEPGIFMKRYRDYGDDEKSELILLNKNFRSRRALIDSVNHIFRQIMHENIGGIEYSSDQELKSGAPYGEDSDENKTELCLIEKDAEGETDALEEEAAYIASRIREMEGSFSVTDFADGKAVLRKAVYSDFAILMRSVAGSDEVIRDILISRGIPAVTETRTGYFKTEEVRYVLNILNILDNPRQDIPLIAVLKSSFGGFNDEELSMIRGSLEKGCFFDALKKGELTGDLDEKRRAFLSRLEEFRSLLPHTPIHELIRRIIDDGFFFRAAAMGNGAKENLELLIKRASDYEKTSYRGLFRFIRYIERMKKYDMDFGEAAVNSEGGAVRILSIHKSKGLEFPVVFLAGIHKHFNMTDCYAKLAVHKDLGLGLELVDQKRKVRFDPPLKKAVSGRMKMDVIGEELRIFYVALTRAREKLIMTGTVKDADKVTEKLYSLPSAMSYLDFIMSARGKDEDGFIKFIDIKTVSLEDILFTRLEEGICGEETRRRIESFKDAVPTEITLLLRKNLEWKYPHEGAVATPSKVSVSELKKRAMDEIADEEGKTPEEVPKLFHMADKEEASLRGIAFHKVMSLLKSDISPDIKEVRLFLEELVSNKNLLPSERELVNPDHVAEFLKTGLWSRMNRALKGGRLFREQPFIMGRKASEIFPGGPEDEMVQVQGIIDAFFEEEGKIVVMDYKTDRVRSEEMLVKRYKKQLELYALALKQVLNLPVTEMKIYSVCLKKEIDL